MSATCTLISCGSFNPITVMHLRMFELARHHLKTKRGIQATQGVISPTNDSYAVHKPSLSPARHRVAMIQSALKDIECNWLSCDDWETRQKDWIRTLPALQHYETVYGRNLILLCGADLVDSFLVPGLWADEHIEEILKSYGLVVLPRPGTNTWKLLYESAKSHIFKNYIDRIQILDGFEPASVSSTMVRDYVREGKPIDHLVTRSVAAYISKHSLYKY